MHPLAFGPHNCICWAYLLWNNFWGTSWFLPCHDWLMMFGRLDASLVEIGTPSRGEELELGKWARGSLRTRESCRSLFNASRQRRPALKWQCDSDHWESWFDTKPCANHSIGIWIAGPSAILISVRNLRNQNKNVLFYNLYEKLCEKIQNKKYSTKKFGKIRKFSLHFVCFRRFFLTEGIKIADAQRSLAS